MKAIRLVSCSMLALLIASCANRGVGPQGGPKDSLPPMVVKEMPVNGTVDYHGDKVEVTFDEYVQLIDVGQNVIISPPQLHAPEIRCFGKKVLVTFADTLQPNTTYTLDFGNAICDNNERIPYSNYTLAFSTGQKIDSLGVFGRVVNAEDLNPVSGVTIGLQEVLEDSAFTTLPFTRIGRTDSLGYFAIKNIRRGKYRVYALQDNSRDYVYQPGEDLAFNHTIYEPYLKVEGRRDTIYEPLDEQDTLAQRQIDTIMNYEIIYMEPSDLVLWYFKEEKTPQYFTRAVHESPHQLTLTFAAPVDSLPILRALPPSAVDSLGNDSAWVDWLAHTVLQSSLHQDTLTYWITDSVAMLDTLIFEMRYRKTDSTYALIWAMDTVRALYRAPRLNARTKAKLEQQQREKKVDIKTNAKSSFEAYDTLRLQVDAPLKWICKDSIHLTTKVDSLTQALPFELRAIDSAKMHYLIIADLKQGGEYALRIDSAAMEDIYGHLNTRSNSRLKLKSAEDYATLRVHVPDAPANLRMQLLSDKDQVWQDQPIRNGQVYFEYIQPGACYLRVYEDLNGDGRWTTGDWDTKRQPEPVYYFPSRLSLRANWYFEESFRYKQVPQLESKPFEIVTDISKQKSKK